MSEYSFLTKAMIAWSISSPPTRMDSEATMPPSEITATSVVPPPTSTTMLPGSCTGSPAPIAAAIGSSMMYTRLAPAWRPASFTALCSTPVIPLGTATTSRGLARCRRWCTFWMK